MLMVDNTYELEVHTLSLKYATWLCIPKDCLTYVVLPTIPEIYTTLTLAIQQFIPTLIMVNMTW